MKKVALLGILSVLLFGLFAACGQSAPQKSVDELKAEVRAELEAGKNNAAGKSFEAILSSDGLRKAFEHYDQYSSTWDSDSKKDFLIKIVSELGRRSVRYIEDLEGIEQDDAAIPPLYQYEASLYESVYDSESNTLYLGSLSDGNRDAVEKVLSDDVFILTKLYFVDQDLVEDLGFTAIIPYDISQKLKEWAAGLDEEIEFHNYELTRYPNGYIKAADTSWDPSGKTYGHVYVESKENLELLLPGRKTEAYLKVNTDEGKKHKGKALLENELSLGYTYRVDNGVLKLKYNNTGNEIDLVESRPAQNNDVTTFISDFQNIRESYDGSRLFFEVPAFAVTNAIHVVDLVTLEERFFTDGFFVDNVGEDPYIDAVIVLKLPMTDSGRGAVYHVVDGQGNKICELGPTLDEDNIVGQISSSIE